MLIPRTCSSRSRVTYSPLAGRGAHVFAPRSRQDARQRAPPGNVRAVYL